LMRLRMGVVIGITTEDTKDTEDIKRNTKS